MVIVGQGQGFNRFFRNRIQIIDHRILDFTMLLCKGNDGIHAGFSQRCINRHASIIGIIGFHIGFVACPHGKPHKHGCQGYGQQDRHHSHCPASRMDAPPNLPQEEQIFFFVLMAQILFCKSVQQKRNLAMQLVNTHQNEQAGPAKVQKRFIGLCLKHPPKQNHACNHRSD